VYCQVNGTGSNADNSFANISVDNVLPLMDKHFPDVSISGVTNPLEFTVADNDRIVLSYDSDAGEWVIASVVSARQFAGHAIGYVTTAAEPATHSVDGGIASLKPATYGVAVV